VPTFAVIEPVFVKAAVKAVLRDEHKDQSIACKGEKV
jgi:hypothetical protein